MTMDPQLWWYVARASGLTAWWLVSAAVLWGLLLSTRVMGGRPAPSWLLDLHRWLAGLSVSFTAVHLVALVLEPRYAFGWAELLVPFAREADPPAQACGVVAVYLLAAVHLTSLLKSRLPDRMWRHLHRLAFGVFTLATAHTFTAGSDAGGLLVRVSGALVGAAFVFLLVYRLAAGRRAAARPESRKPTAQQAAPAAPSRLRGPHALTVVEVRRETSDAVSVAFRVPDELAPEFRFRPGQHVTLHAVLDGTEVRRPYSICSGITDGELRVAVKAQPDGLVSGWVNTTLRAGDLVKVGVPSGRFAIDLNPLRGRHVLGIAAGSGITPILSIVKSVLAVEPRSRCTLVYANRDAASTIFRDELDGLERQHGERLGVVHVLSQARVPDPLRQGRLTGSAFRELAKARGLADGVESAFLCGPADLVTEIRCTLISLGLAAERIHSERFAASPGAHTAGRKKAPAGGARAVTVIDRGTRTTVTVRPDETVLDAGLRAGLDLPHSCREGICGTCRARRAGGEVELDDCDLTDAEIAAGYVLACRTRPLAEGVSIDFDQA
ncbi:2Fe-2S iron-sulfur cluster-binding protein [Streptomyces sp. NPDC127110]|uniref:2Fe-2S iron-sulfur cluster-binding protein n=1 Tax=Streptomyces sp. NPDC127110 TaxID=3345362 RepID=UPI00362DE35B